MSDDDVSPPPKGDPVRQLPLSFPADERYGAADFMPADCNAQALSWVARWPDWPGPVLCLHGPAGCGKTHLLHIWAARSGARLIDGGELDADSVWDLAGRPVAIDRADRIRDEAALLHLYNLQREAALTDTVATIATDDNASSAPNRRPHLLMAAQQPPNRWGIALPDLASRLATVPAVGIDAPDDGLLSALLVKHAAARHLDLPPEVIRYLVQRIERSFHAAEEVVAALDRTAIAGRRRRVTLAMASRLLKPSQATDAEPDRQA